MGKSTIYKWPCSIAMLVYRRVPGVTLLNSGVLGFTWRHLRPGDRPQQLVGSRLHARNHVLWWLAFGALRAPDERPGVKQQKWGFNEKGNGNLLPSGNLTVSYWKWPIEIVDLPINSMVIFHRFLLTFTRGYIHQYPSLIPSLSQQIIHIKSYKKP